MVAQSGVILSYLCYVAGERFSFIVDSFTKFEEMELGYLRKRFNRSRPYFGHLVNSVASSPDYARFLKSPNSQ